MTTRETENGVYYSMVFKKDVWNIINKHKAEKSKVFALRGFAFNGRSEKETSFELLDEIFNWMAFCDIEIIGSDIHINAFSASDLYC